MPPSAPAAGAVLPLILIKRKKGMYICVIASFVLGIAGKVVDSF